MILKIIKSLPRRILTLSMVVVGTVMCAAVSVAFVLSARTVGVEPGNVVTTGDFVRTVVLSGSLEAQKAEVFSVPFTNTWQLQLKWIVNEGQLVQPGQPVARFDTASLTSDISQLEDSLLLKKEQKKQKEQDYRLQEFELSVNVKKAEIAYEKSKLDADIPRGIESGYDYDRKQLELKKSRQTLKTAKNNKSVKLENLKADIEKMDIEIEEAELKLDKSRTMLQKLTLLATTSGPVVYGENRWQGRKVQIGDNLFPGFTVATIPDKSSLQVAAWVNETDIRKIKPGQKVDMILDAYTEKRFSGTITDVLNNAEEKKQWGKTNYFRASLSLDTVDPAIMKPGMSVKCLVRAARFTGVRLVPLTMSYHDGKHFWIKTRGNPLMKIQPLDFNNFYLALSASQEGDLPVDGDILEPVDPGAVERQVEARDAPGADPHQSPKKTETVTPVNDAGIDKKGTREKQKNTDKNTKQKDREGGVEHRDRRDGGRL